MRILDALYAKSDELRLGDHITPTAGDGSMNGADFVTAEFHEDSFFGSLLMSGFAQPEDSNESRLAPLLQFVPEGDQWQIWQA